MITFIGVKMADPTHYICSNNTVCTKGILPRILTYLVIHQCTDLQTLYDGRRTRPFMHTVNLPTIYDIVSNPDQSELPSLFHSKNTTNSTNIVIGPELADEKLLYGNSSHFQMTDKLLKSDGVVVVVRYQELDVQKLILESVGDTKGLLIVSLLLAVIMSFLVWFAVSEIFRVPDGHFLIIFLKEAYKLGE